MDGPVRRHGGAGGAPPLRTRTEEEAAADEAGEEGRRPCQVHKTARQVLVGARLTPRAVLRTGGTARIPLLRTLASLRVRLFLCCWLVYGLFFATNIVREHYAAFAVLDRGDWVCDRYAGMHPDIFLHSDGHWYVGNNVMGSLIAAAPLLAFDPLLDRLEERSRQALAASPAPPDTTYQTRYPLRREAFRRIKLAGLDLRFGASAALTSLLLMAPLSALLVVLVHELLRRRGLDAGRALWLAILFGFGTPLLYRSAHLNHNMFLMQALFGAFLLLWLGREEGEPHTLRRRIAAGFLCGIAFALDYAGAIPVAVLTAYMVIPRVREAGVATAARESLPFVLAGLPGLLFLLGTQWAMYGDPFAPGQFVMNAVNYTEKGVRGIGLPSVEVFTKNLFSPGWGLLTFGPLLALGFLPARYGESELLFPRRERRWSAALVLTFMLFCAANWYSLMQFNSGFRYLLPVVPFLFLAASDHLARLPKTTLAILSAPILLHSVVLSMAREVADTEKELRDAAEAAGISELALDGYWQRLLTETAVPLSYQRLLELGPQLPWLTVLRQTHPQHAWLASPLLPLGLMAACALAVAAIWRAGARTAARVPAPALES